MSDSHEMLLNQFLEEKEKANSTDALETLRVKYLGKKVKSQNCLRSPKTSH